MIQPMLLLCVVVLYVHPVASACSCHGGDWKSVQNVFCQADFVIQAEIKTIKVKKNVKSYIIQISNTYKMPKSKVNTKTIEMKETNCWLQETIANGVIKNKQTYVLFGQVDGSRLTMDKCDSIAILADKVNKQLLQNLNAGFKDNCMCQVEYVRYREDLHDAKSNSNCVGGDKDFKCLDQFSLCKNKGGVCSWVYSDTVDKCIESTDSGRGFIPQQIDPSKKRLKGKKKS